MKRMKFKNGIKASLIILMALVAGNAYSQEIEITPGYGYQFGSRLDYPGGYLEIEDSDQYNLVVGVSTFRNVVTEITYIRHSTSLLFRDRKLSPNEATLSDLNMDWIMIGGKRVADNGKVRPFIGGGFGVVIFTPSNQAPNLISSNLSSSTRMGMNFKGGVNLMFSDRVGLNLQANLLMPINWGGVYVSAGSGGTSAGLSLGSSTLIAGFSGGLVFSFGE